MGRPGAGRRRQLENLIIAKGRELCSSHLDYSLPLGGFHLAPALLAVGRGPLSISGMLARPLLFILNNIAVCYISQEENKPKNKNFSHLSTCVADINRSTQGPSPCTFPPLPPPGGVCQIPPPLQLLTSITGFILIWKNLDIDNILFRY